MCSNDLPKSLPVRRNAARFPTRHAAVVVVDGLGLAFKNIGHVFDGLDIGLAFEGLGLPMTPLALPLTALALALLLKTVVLPLKVLALPLKALSN